MSKHKHGKGNRGAFHSVPADTRAPGSEAPESAARAPLDPFAVLQDYELRSLAHVVGLPEQLDAPGLWRGVGFRIGHKRLASGFDEVVEIMPMPQVTPVPGAQPWMLGVANIRGNLLPIVDLKQFLEGERTVLHEGQRVLVVRQPGGDVAVTIDELYGQRSFNDEQQIPVDVLSESALAEGRYAHFVDRAYRLAEDAWGIFSLERLARTPEFRQAAA
jgi:twitching motility protein PilI